MSKKKLARVEAKRHGAANADTFEDDADLRNRRLKQIVFMAGFERNPSPLIMRVAGVNGWQHIYNYGATLARIAADKQNLALCQSSNKPE